MTIHKSKSETELVLILSGRLDSISGPYLQDTLNGAFDESTRVALDFSELCYLSSAGLRVLLTSHKIAKGRKCSLVIRNVSDEIKEVFTMTGFLDFLVIEQ